LSTDNANTGGSNRSDRIADGNLARGTQTIDGYWAAEAFAKPRVRDRRTHNRQRRGETRPLFQPQEIVARGFRLKQKHAR
jgi:hypothetical protein